MTLLSACAAQQIESAVILDAPKDLVFSRLATSESFRYRGADGETWLFTILKYELEGELGGREMYEKAVTQEQAKLRQNVSAWPISKTDRRDIAENGTLLVSAHQSSRGGLPYSTVDFAALWERGLLVMGVVEWPNVLDPRYENVRDHLARMRPR